MPKIEPPAERYREARERIAAGGLSQEEAQAIAGEALAGSGKPGRPRKNDGRLEQRIAEREAELK